MRHLWSLFCKTLGLSCLLSLSCYSFSAELTDLFQAEVDANQSQSQWQQAAVSAVLVKLTGGEQILTHQAVKTAIRSSSDFIKQYQMVQRDGRNLLQVSLDQQKITSMLQQLQIPIWGSRRPDVLIWLTEKTLDQPQLVLLAEHPLRNALAAQAKRYGLSYLYPKYDEQELAQVNAPALWSGDWTGLSQVSPRYQATQVFNLLLEQQVDMTGQLQFRLTLQTMVDAAIQQQELSGPDATALLLQFSQQLAAAQAAKYAVNVQASAVSDGAVQLTLDGIEGLTDLVAVQKVFSSMLTVRQQQLVEFKPGTATIRLTFAASELDFYQALALEKKLQPVIKADGTVIDPANMDQPSVDQAAIAQNATQPSVDNPPAISAAEQALEAALSTDSASTTEMPQAAAQTETPVAVPVEVQIPAGHTHFRFVRP
ncbi:hypothetical protein A5320_07625 [Rheinheimera sp. SA_1]|uniref:DUF2066 domain-containing protein n=1 Tax=Rheinheimera sp. SA_1 TaxID=1827365 RepID=UPI0007FCCE46|nr:DUF2066 domain-containing protein [Rheinheimera sp. SA_1]OBP15240.1 hypothetical protein A5320_07625 [Rheinheimera sp. SA_1]